MIPDYVRLHIQTSITWSQNNCIFIAFFGAHKSQKFNKLLCTICWFTNYLYMLVEKKEKKKKKTIFCSKSPFSQIQQSCHIHIGTSTYVQWNLGYYQELVLSSTLIICTYSSSSIGLVHAWSVTSECLGIKMLTYRH